MILYFFKFKNNKYVLLSIQMSLLFCFNLNSNDYSLSPRTKKLDRPRNLSKSYSE